MVLDSNGVLTQRQTISKDILHPFFGKPPLSDIRRRTNLPNIKSVFSKIMSDFTLDQKRFEFLYYVQRFFLPFWLQNQNLCLLYSEGILKNILFWGYKIKSHIYCIVRIELTLP